MSPPTQANLRARAAVAPQAFEERYRANADPWNYGSSDYERGKYNSTLSALQRDRYASAFEPACSIGELTAMLAPLCAKLFAIDVSPTAVARARQTCASYPDVSIECADLRTRIPAESFDLIVLSEIGYYFDCETLAALTRRLALTLQPGGELIAVHWLGQSGDHVLHGDEVHAVLHEVLPFRHTRGERHPGFRLDSWKRI